MIDVVTAKDTTMDRSDSEGRPGGDLGRGAPGVPARGRGPNRPGDISQEDDTAPSAGWGAAPRAHGLDTVGTIKAMRDGRVKVFVAMGGNFVLAAPDTDATTAALRTTELTVQVSTKLNRSHLVHGRQALILRASAAPRRTPGRRGSRA